VGIIIVDLPTWFNHEQEKSHASPGYQCERDKEYFHDSMLPKFPNDAIRFNSCTCALVARHAQIFLRGSPQLGRRRNSSGSLPIFAARNSRIRLYDELLRLLLRLNALRDAIARQHNATLIHVKDMNGGGRGECCRLGCWSPLARHQLLNAIGCAALQKI
jgi:hypothetical protein